MRLLKSLGFKHAIYEDNYPLCEGDYYSPKQALMRAEEGHSYPFRKWAHGPLLPQKGIHSPARRRRSFSKTKPEYLF